MTRKEVQTIKEVKDSTTSGLEYELIARVKNTRRLPPGVNIYTINDGIEDFRLTVFSEKPTLPKIKAGVIAKFLFKRKSYEGELQGSLIDAEIVEDKDILEKFRKIQTEKYRPKEKLLHEGFKPLENDLKDAATIILGAIHTNRPILITHHADTDGYCAALQLEAAILPLIKSLHPTDRYLAHYYTRNASRTPYYDLVDATRDIGFFLQHEVRQGVGAPLILVVDNGAGKEDQLSIEKVALYGAEFIVIDHHKPQISETTNGLLKHVNPHKVGLDKEFSASMLCYQLSAYLQKESPNAFMAALGGLADKSKGVVVDWLVEQSGSSREYLEDLYVYVDYEIFLNKYSFPDGPLYTMLNGPKEKRDALVNLYKPILEEQKQQLLVSAKKYLKEETLGQFKTYLIDEDVTFFYDYLSIGKLVAILHKEHTGNRVTMVLTDSVIIFRVEQDKPLFDVNKLVKYLQEKIPYARVNGGGHAVAGSIKFIKVAKENVLDEVKKYILSL